MSGRGGPGQRRGARKPPQKRSGQNNGQGGGPKDLRALLIERMEDCKTAEALNDRVILPFIQAFEDVCEARGYVMNIYGDKSNLVFTGSEDAAEEIYALVESYLDVQGEAEEDDD